MPPTGEARARRCSTTPTANGFDLAEGVAYADSTSDLPMLEAVGFPVAVNPETRLAALARKRGWLVEHLDKATGAPQPLLPIGPEWGRPRRRRVGKVDTVESREAAMKALVFSRKPAKFAAAMVAGRLAPGGGAKVGPLSLRDVDPPELPGPGLGAGAPPPGRHLRLATSPPSTARRRATSSRSCRSRSCPATRWSATSTTASASCVVPVLSCVARGIDPVCPPCADGPHQPLRAHRLRPPRARPADRLLREHRRRLVDADGRPREPAASPCPTS